MSIQSLPQINLISSQELVIEPQKFLGQWLILYFYPRDNTPGCTVEALDFSSLISKFEFYQAQVYGISPDTPKSHCNFISKKNLRIELLCDPEHKFIEACGFWKLKKFMGKEFMGVVRSTLLVDPQGLIRFQWSPVTVKGHAQEVLDKLIELHS